MPAPRLVVAALATVGVVALAAPPAAAHVSVAEPVTAGGIGEVTLTVPNERDDSGTVVLEVQLPQDHPLPLVSPRAKPGWESEVTMRTLDEPVELFGREVTEVVDTVRWSGGTIEPGAYDTFTLRAGPFPDDVDELALPAIQTYASGEEVAWIEDGEDAEHPSPVLAIAADGTGATGAHGEAVDAGDADDEAGDEQALAGSDDDGGDGTDPLGVAALVLSLVALALGGTALAAARSRR